MRDQIDKRRRQIDRIDIRLVELLARRARLAREIGICKRRLRRGVSDSRRERQVIGRMEREAKAIGLDPAFMGAIARKIIAYCKKEQKR